MSRKKICKRIPKGDVITPSLLDEIEEYTYDRLTNIREERGYDSIQFPTKNDIINAEDAAIVPRVAIGADRAEFSSKIHTKPRLWLTELTLDGLDGRCKDSATWFVTNESVRDEIISEIAPYAPLPSERKRCIDLISEYGYPFAWAVTPIFETAENIIEEYERYRRSYPNFVEMRLGCVHKIKFRIDKHAQHIKVLKEFYGQKFTLDDCDYHDGVIEIYNAFNNRENLLKLHDHFKDNEMVVFEDTFFTALGLTTCLSGKHGWYSKADVQGNWRCGICDNDCPYCSNNTGLRSICKIFPDRPSIYLEIKPVPPRRKK